MDYKKTLSLLGLAAKAGKIASGEFMTEKTVKDGHASLVIVAEDASDNTKKMFTNMCTYYKVPLYFFSRKDGLGHAIGREMRASLSVLDDGFAKAVEKQMNKAVFEGGSKYDKKEST